MTEVTMVKQENNTTRYDIVIITDKNQSFGKCNGNGNYIVRRENRKYYRVNSMIEEYKKYKKMGYKVLNIYNY